MRREINLRLIIKIGDDAWFRLVCVLLASRCGSVHIVFSSGHTAVDACLVDKFESKTNMSRQQNEKGMQKSWVSSVFTVLQRETNVHLHILYMLQISNILTFPAIHICMAVGARRDEALLCVCVRAHVSACVYACVCISPCVRECVRASPRPRTHSSRPTQDYSWSCKANVSGCTQSRSFK